MQLLVSVWLSGYERPLHVLLEHFLVGGFTQCLHLVLTPTSPHVNDEHKLQLLHFVQKLSVPVCEVYFLSQEVIKARLPLSQRTQ